MDNFVSTYVWPAAIMIGQSLLLLVCLLVFIAYILLADRKIWAAVQLRRGPNVVGPWGLFQSFADLLKFVFKIADSVAASCEAQWRLFSVGQHNQGLRQLLRIIGLLAMYRQDRFTRAGWILRVISNDLLRESYRVRAEELGSEIPGLDNSHL